MQIHNQIGKFYENDFYCFFCDQKSDSGLKWFVHSQKNHDSELRQVLNIPAYFIDQVN